MTIHVRDSTGALREIVEIHVRDSTGTLREIQEGWVRDASGTLRQFYSAFALLLTSIASSATAVSPSSATAVVNFLADGDLTGSFTGHTDEWGAPLSAGIGISYEVCFYNVSGDTADLTGPSYDTGATPTTFHTISTTRTWSVTRSINGTSSVTGNMRVREIADTSNFVDASVTIQATRSIS